jgi:hypothetical protein
MDEHMISTVDNPFNPFRDFDEWNAWDMRAGYHTLSFLARIAHLSNDLSEIDEYEATEAAIDEMVRENVLGLYIKVTRDSEAPRKPLTLTPSSS